MPGPIKEIRYEASHSSIHHTVLEGIKARLHLSLHGARDRQKTYASLEDQFLAYVPESEVDAHLRSKKESGEPQYTTLVIPYTYAEVMTMHTYYTTVLLGRAPIFQYNGRHGEPMRKKMAVEAVMGYQTRQGRNVVPLYVWLLDALKYGRGILGTYWDDQFSYFTEEEEVQITLAGIPIRTKTISKQKRILQYSGNRFFTVRPQQFHPDPRVPTAYLQDGEFVGRDTTLSWNALVRGKAEGRYFNIMEAKKYLKQTNLRRQHDDTSIKLDLPQEEEIITDPKDTGYLDILEMFVEIIPREWRLGTSSIPEKWVFEVVSESVIISARAFGAYHDQFPYFSLEPEFDGYSLNSRSPSEVIKPLEDTLTWLFNSHFYNVRKTLNDQYLVDPSRVEMADVLDPLPGGILRATPLAYGTDMRTAISQLPINDVTRQNIPDTQYVMEILQRVDGVNDSVLGLIQGSGRKTATEVRQGSTFAVSRLKTKAEFLSAMGLEPLAAVALQNTQQYYSQDMMFRIAGNLAVGSEPFVQVDPEAIAGFFDFVPLDGSLPLDKFALSNLWRQLFVDAAKLPPELGVAQQLDFMAIFDHTAKLMGAVDIDQFRVQAQPNEQVAAQAQAGNLVPISPGGIPSAGPANEGDERAAGRFPLPAQVAGMGPAG